MHAHTQQDEFKKTHSRALWNHLELKTFIKGMMGTLCGMCCFMDKIGRKYITITANVILREQTQTQMNTYPLLQVFTTAE